jgi:nucleobase transporter 1/2
MVLSYDCSCISLAGKVGAFIASIPDVMVAALLCFMWAMLCALGLSNLRYGATGSSRNCIVVGLALFLSLSIPSYFQQYGLHPNANSSVPTYFQPYNVASHGPIHTGFGGVCTELPIFCRISFHCLLLGIFAL